MTTAGGTIALSTTVIFSILRQNFKEGVYLESSTYVAELFENTLKSKI